MSVRHEHTPIISGSCVVPVVRYASNAWRDQGEHEIKSTRRAPIGCDRLSSSAPPHRCSFASVGLVDSAPGAICWAWSRQRGGAKDTTASRPVSTRLRPTYFYLHKGALAQSSASTSHKPRPVGRLTHHDSIDVVGTMLENERQLPCQRGDAPRAVSLWRMTTSGGGGGWQPGDIESNGRGADRP